MSPIAVTVPPFRPLTHFPFFSEPPALPDVRPSVGQLLPLCRFLDCQKWPNLHIKPKSKKPALQCFGDILTPVFLIMKITFFVLVDRCNRWIRHKIQSGKRVNKGQIVGGTIEERGFWAFCGLLCVIEVLFLNQF